MCSNSPPHALPDHAQLPWNDSTSLRDELEVKSVKAACWRGECGLCTVLLNGSLVKSCLVLAVEADTREVTTAEGIGENGRLAPELVEVQAHLSPEADTPHLHI